MPMWTIVYKNYIMPMWTVVYKNYIMPMWTVVYKNYIMPMWTVVYLCGSDIYFVFVSVSMVILLICFEMFRQCAILWFTLDQYSFYVSRQSVRATCILIPLLGIQYVVLPFRPPAGNEHGQYVYDLVSASLSSFQVGF
jgi:hypothetical protein